MTTNDVPIATPINKISTPPSEERFSRILLPAMERMGTSNAAVAVCEMKFAVALQISPEPTIINTGGHVLNGIASIMCLASP